MSTYRSTPPPDPLWFTILMTLIVIAFIIPICIIGLGFGAHLVAALIHWGWSRF